jgi:hypothetical protein
MGREDVEADVVVGVDGRERFLRSRKMPLVDVLIRSVMSNELFSLLSCDVKARESVRGRKKPSLPSGMESPWTT